MKGPQEKEHGWRTSLLHVVILPEVVEALNHDFLCCAGRDGFLLSSAGAVFL